MSDKNRLIIYRIFLSTLFYPCYLIIVISLYQIKQKSHSFLSLSYLQTVHTVLVFSCWSFGRQFCQIWANYFLRTSVCLPSYHGVRSYVQTTYRHSLILETLFTLCCILLDIFLHIQSKIMFTHSLIHLRVTQLFLHMVIVICCHCS